LGPGLWLFSLVHFCHSDAKDIFLGGLDGQWKQIWKDSFKSRGKDSSGDSERDLNSIVLRLRSETGVMQLLFWASLVLSHFFAAIQAQVRYEEYVAVASSLVSSPYPILYLAGLD